MIKFVSLISGSSGNSTFISDGETNILVDCGMSGIQLKKSLSDIDVSCDDIDAVLITHEHIDHTKGVGVISRRHKIPVYATENTHASLQVGNLNEVCIINPYSDFEIGSIGVKAFSIPHDAADPVGYNFFIDNQKITVATDLGHMNDDLLSHLYNSKMILLESNHNVEMLKCGSYPFPLKQRILSDHGHLSNENAAKTAIELIKSGTEHIMLGHLSKENNTPEIALMTASQTISSSGIFVGSDMTLQVAHRSNVTSF